MAKARINCLFVLPDLSGGGAEKVTLTLLKHLDRTEFSPSLLLFRKQGAFVAEVPADVPLITALTEQRNSVLDILKILLAIKKAARSADVVVGSLELKGIFFAVVGAMLARRPAIAWVHKHLGYYLAHQSLPVRVVYWLVCALVFSIATRVVTVCAESAQSIKHLFGWCRSRVSYHYNPIDYSAIDKLAAGAVRPPQYEQQVLAVGRLTGQKGFDILLHAMALVVEHCPEAKLCILGEGELRANLEALRQQLKLTRHVSMPGFTSPYKPMSEAGIFVMSSRYEGLPTVMLEAMYCGAAVVSTSCPSGPREILAEGRYGALVPSEDPQALAEALVLLLQQPERVRELGDIARKRMDDFALPHICSAWQQEIRESAGKTQQ